ncbi:MAG: type II CAAX endopeptidase family protein [Myxococcota bacterium]|nr:type II CAAX endopeptidase family protein [Myxococcota bacterium]
MAHEQPTQSPTHDVIFILIGGFLGLVIGGACVGLLPMSMHGRRIALATWSFLWFIGVAWLVTAGRDQRSARLGLVPCPPVTLMYAALLGCLAMPMVGWLASSLRAMVQPGAENPQLQYVVFDDASGLGSAVMVFLIVIALPIAEEVLYRGALYDALRRIHGTRFAIWMSAAIFGFMHFEFAVSVGTFALGLLYGVLRERSGSILPCAVAHIVNNGLAYLVANAAH